MASGCNATPDGLRNDGALALQAASAPGRAYADINTVALAEPIAPHLAAADAGLSIDTRRLAAAASDCVVVEGAGAWHVPLSDDADPADRVGGDRWPTLLVVGIRLGCVNHAVLSARAIAARTTLVGWVANTVPRIQPRLADNVACLKRLIAAPLRAHVVCRAPATLALNPGPWLARS